MHLPSFLWLWKLAAWSMGLSLVAYALLVVSGLGMRRLMPGRPGLLRRLHIGSGLALVSLTLLLLAIGVVGTLGHFGSLGHSAHLPAGLTVTALVATSAWSAWRITRGNTWARVVHVGSGGLLFGGFLVVLVTGWAVVQKYLP